MKQQREFFGRVQRFALLALPLGQLAISACSSAAMDSTSSMPIVLATRPGALVTRVPLQGDPDCGGPPSMAFEADILEQDIEQPLFAVLVVNGAVRPSQVVHPNGSTTRLIPTVCVPHSALSNPCNAIELIVSVTNPPAAREGNSGSLRWLVLGPPSGDNASSPSDCSAWLPDSGV